jgi:hypothetical protein
MNAGTYQIKLKLIDRHAYSVANPGNSNTWKTKTVERWFNSEAERDDLFARWAEKGIEAKLGRFVGR